MIRILKTFPECVQTQGLTYDRFDQIIRVEGSFMLKYSRYWIEKNSLKTEWDIRASMSFVDGYEVTLHDSLFYYISIFNQSTYWKTHRSEILKIKDMSTEHLQNIIKMFQDDKKNSYAVLHSNGMAHLQSDEYFSYFVTTDVYKAIRLELRSRD